MTRKRDLLRSFVRRDAAPPAGSAGAAPGVGSARRGAALRIVLLPAGLVGSVVLINAAVGTAIEIGAALLGLYALEIGLLVALGGLRWLRATDRAAPPEERVRRRVLRHFRSLQWGFAVAGVFVALSLVGRRALHGRGSPSDFGVANALLVGAVMAWFVRRPFLDG